MAKRADCRRLAIAAVVAIAVIPGQLSAKSTTKGEGVTLSRKVVLMEFKRASVDPAVGLEAGPADDLPVADVAQTMASAFTISPRAAAATADAAATPPGISAASLPNPFLSRAVDVPFRASPHFYAGGSCDEMVYQPDYSHGRSAEERRRIFYPLVHQVACEQGLPIGLLDALIMQESGYNHAAISRKGALGLAQLMPGTARYLGANPYAILENLRGGARYLHQQIERFGRYDLALAAYNAGPERVARYGRIPAIAETVGYVRNISAKWSHLGRAKLASITPPTGRRAQMIFMSYAERAADKNIYQQ